MDEQERTNELYAAVLHTYLQLQLALISVDPEGHHQILWQQAHTLEERIQELGRHLGLPVTSS